MNTNITNNNKIIHPELSYKINGLCFNVHNQLGRFAREKQYSDLIEERLKEADILYVREYRIDKTGNIVDFLIDEKIILEVKSKRFILKEDYYQLQRYLQASNKRLGMLVNFRNRYLKPWRVVKIDSYHS